MAQRSWLEQYKDANARAFHEPNSVEWFIYLMTDSNFDSFNFPAKPKEKTYFQGSKPRTCGSSNRIDSVSV